MTDIEQNGKRMRTGIGSAVRSGLRRKLVTRLGLVLLLAAGVGLATRIDHDTEPQGPAELSLAADGETMKQTEVEALATARATGRAIEIGAFRGERREVLANPDGTFTENNYLQPFRTVKDRKWVPVDASLTVNPDGSLSPRAATFGLRLSGGGEGPFATLERSGRSISLTWPGKLPAPTVEGDTATYSEVSPGVDLVVHAGVSSFSHVFVVKNAQAARRAEITDLALGVSAKGIKLKDTGEGRLAAVDTVTGGRIFEAPAPGMWDSGEGGQAQRSAGRAEPATKVAPDAARKATLGVRVVGDKLHLTPDRALLEGSATKWPVYIDPMWSSTNTSFWAMVDSGYSDTEYPKFDGAFQTKGDERAGYCPPDSSCNDSKIKRLFYALPTSYSGKTILSAQFQITMVNGWNTTARNISLYRMTAGISTSTNWSNQPNGSAWSGAVKQQTKALSAEQSCSTSTRNVSFDATESVQYAAANGKTTTTFGLRADNESDNTHWKRFCENALLSVNWNRAPSTPVTAELTMSPGGTCVYGSARPYVDAAPRLSAILRDPDHLAVSGVTESVKAEFRLSWTPAGGTLQTVTWQSSMLASGSRFDYNVPTTLPKDTVISWDVRAGDSSTWGPWSSDGALDTCEFIWDIGTPSSPLVSSPEYLSTALASCGTTTDPTPRDGVGVYGTFTFDSTATDVYQYRYGFDTNPSPNNVLSPTVDGGAVSTRWLALSEGPHFVTVQAVDRASKSSVIATCNFVVAAGRLAAGEWGMADAAGATEAADARGVNPAVVAGDVTFGVAGPGGAADRAAHLPGTWDSYLSTANSALVDTSRDFSVSAWVKPDTISRNLVVLSQDGSGEPGFTLGLDAVAGKWKFSMPTTDVNSLGTWRVTGGTPQVGQWAHLVGVYDADKRTMSLHVDGQPPTVADRRSTWMSHGAVQIGRRTAKTGYTDHFAGDIAEVAMFDRIVVPAEITQMSALPPKRKGYWELDEVGGVSAPTGGGQSLTLAGGAAVVLGDDFADPPVIPMLGTGELRLDGVDGNASTALPMVDTSGSFSVVARVRVVSEDAGPAMTVLSQKGVHGSGFVVRRNAANRWELALSSSDTVGAAVVTAADDQVVPSADMVGQQLALVYNGFTNQARLYVDGQLADSAVADQPLAWNAGGGFQVGRAFLDDQWQEYFAGAVDEVRVYSGVLDPTTVQQLNQLVELPDL